MSARRDLASAVVASARMGEGWPVEADEDVNDACRRVVTEMQEAQAEPVWLGKINRGLGATKGQVECWLWPWDGTTVYTFSCAFVAPRRDDELIRLLQERDAVPYTGVADDVPRVDAIMNRITAIGGVHLFWT